MVDDYVLHDDGSGLRQKKKKNSPDQNLSTSSLVADVMSLVQPTWVIVFSSDYQCYFGYEPSSSFHHNDSSLLYVFCDDTLIWRTALQAE